MKRRDLIYIIIILALVVFGYFWMNNYEEKIKFINNERERLTGEVDVLIQRVTGNDALIYLYGEKVKAGEVTIDSLKNIEHEIPIIIIDDIPVSERNSTIRRLAAK